MIPDPGVPGQKGKEFTGTSDFMVMRKSFHMKKQHIVRYPMEKNLILLLFWLH